MTCTNQSINGKYENLKDISGATLQTKGHPLTRKQN